MSASTWRRLVDDLTLFDRLIETLIGVTLGIATAILTRERTPPQA